MESEQVRNEQVGKCAGGNVVYHSVRIVLVLVLMLVLEVVSRSDD